MQINTDNFRLTIIHDLNLLWLTTWNRDENVLSQQ